MSAATAPLSNTRTSSKAGMNTLVRANVMAYRRRYTAVIAAITIGVAFLTATLFVGTSMRATLASSVGQNFQHANLVANLSSGDEAGTDDPAKIDQATREFTAKIQKEAAGVQGVDKALVTSRGYGELESDNGSVFSTLTVMDGDPSLLGTALTQGSIKDGQVTLDESTAASKHIGIGDTITVNTSDGDVDANGNAKETPQRFTVSGLTQTPYSPDDAGLAAIHLSAATAQARHLAANPDLLLVGTQPGTDLATARAGLTNAVGHNTVNGMQTPAQAVQATVQDFSGGTDALTWVLAAFAGIALVVSVIVVANTFSVILAQRTRELALLRTLGARRKQVRRMVTGEAAVIGLIGGVLGLVLGTAVVWAGTKILAAAASLPYVSFGFAWWPPVIGLIVGLVVTLLASSRPARAATRVAPLAALRPLDTVTVASRRGVVRIVFGLLLTAAGALALVAGVSGVGGDALAFALAFLGGLISFIGILLLGTLLVPWAVRQLARPFRGSAAGKLSGLNAVRHPQRTAAIGTALLLGVTLVSMMLVGAQAARATMNTELARTMPVDLQVTSSGQQLSDATAQKVSGVPGVQDAALVTPAGADTRGNIVFAADQDALKNVMTQGAHLPRSGTVAAGEDALPKGATQLTLRTDSGTVKVPVDADATAPQGMLLMTTATAQQLHVKAPSAAQAKEAGGTSVWAKANDSVDSGQLLNDVASAAGVSADAVNGALPIRQAASQIIDMLLLVVSALLAVAVVIALIGVSNTLSLSVIERTRENSLLRALGLTKKQLRRMLALEAALIAGAATVLGLVLGSIYGLAGAKAAMLGLGGFTASLPWLWLVVVLVAAVGAAVLASVWPARRATRLSPVEGLAVE